MGEPWKYQSSWKTEDLFVNYYTESEVNVLISAAYGIIPSYSSAPTGKDGMMYINTADDKLYIYWNGAWSELHTLTTSAPVTIETGVPMGLLIGLTYTI